MLRAALLNGQAERLRRDAGLSRAEVGAAIGVSREAVQKWELGDRTPRGDAALKYARLLSQLSRHSQAES
jgi:DNA-binding transcriptional regulator YiaG